MRSVNATPELPSICQAGLRPELQSTVFAVFAARPRDVTKPRGQAHKARCEPIAGRSRKN